jgi:nucleoside-diphosphate-sugar epimerase
MGALNESAAAGPLSLVVTGAGGFVGRHVVGEARARGHRVTAVLRRAQAEDTLPWAGDAQVATVVCDLGAEDAVARLGPLLDGADAVIHAAAALAGDDTAQERDTLRPTRALLAALAGASAGALMASGDSGEAGGEPGAEMGGARRPRLVLVGSLSVYGYAALPAGATLDETTPLEPDPHLRDAYTRAKLAQEAACLAAVQGCGLCVRVLRAGAIYGPGRMWSARIAIAKGPLAILPGGSARVPTVHVADCAQALVLAAETPAGPSDVALPPGCAPGAGFEAIDLVEDDPPTQAACIAALRAGGWTARVVRVPLGVLRRAAQVVSLAGIVLPGLPARMPGLLRAETLDARLKPLRFANARAKDRLGWCPAHSFEAVARARPPASPETDG